MESHKCSKCVRSRLQYMLNTSTRTTRIMFSNRFQVTPKAACTTSNRRSPLRMSPSAAGAGKRLAKARSSTVPCTQRLVSLLVAGQHLVAGTLDFVDERTAD